MAATGAKRLSDRQFLADRQAPQHSTLALVVVDREVLATAIVPDRDRALFPADAGGEFRPRAMRLQEIDQRLALFLGHALEPDRVPVADVKRLAARLRVG